MTDKINHAANQYVRDIFPGYKGDDLEGGTKDAFIAGATSEAAREYWEGQFTPPGATAYALYDADKVNSILTVCMRTMSKEEKVALRDALIERT